MSKRSAVPWWGWGAWVVTLALSVWAYPSLPSQVATHFNAAGQPNGESSRTVAVVFLPALMLVLQLLWSVLWKIDPKKRNYQSFWPTYRYLGGVIVVFLGLVQLWILGHAIGYAWVSIRVVPTLVGVLIMLLSNLLPRLQPNWWIGIRTPWTLSSEESWRQTHRLAGQLGIPVGALMIVLVWVFPASNNPPDDASTSCNPLFHKKNAPAVETIPKYSTPPHMLGCCQVRTGV